MHFQGLINTAQACCEHATLCQVLRPFCLCCCGSPRRTDCGLQALGPDGCCMCFVQINKTFQSFMKHLQQDVWERDYGWVPPSQDCCPTPVFHFPLTCFQHCDLPGMRRCSLAVPASNKKNAAVTSTCACCGAISTRALDQHVASRLLQRQMYRKWMVGSPLAFHTL